MTAETAVPETTESAIPANVETTPVEVKAKKKKKPASEGVQVQYLPLSRFKLPEENEIGHDERQSMPRDSYDFKALVASFKARGWDKDKPAVLRGDVWDNGRTRFAAALAAKVTHGYFLILPPEDIETDPVKAYLDGQLRAGQANAFIESDPWTLAKTFNTLLMTPYEDGQPLTAEEIALSFGCSAAKVAQYGDALHRAVLKYPEEKQKQLISLLLKWELSVKAVLEESDASEEEKVASLDALMARKAKGLTLKPKTKAKPASVVGGLNKSQMNGAIEEISKWELKGPHGLAVKNALIAAFQCAVGTKDYDTLADFANTLAKSKE